MFLIANDKGVERVAIGEIDCDNTDLIENRTQFYRLLTSGFNGDIAIDCDLLSEKSIKTILSKYGMGK